jgi:hypothetical protein
MKFDLVFWDIYLIVILNDGTSPFTSFTWAPTHLTLKTVKLLHICHFR